MHKKNPRSSCPQHYDLQGILADQVRFQFCGLGIHVGKLQLNIFRPHSYLMTLTQQGASWLDASCPSPEMNLGSCYWYIILIWIEKNILIHRLHWFHSMSLSLATNLPRAPDVLRSKATWNITPSIAGRRRPGSKRRVQRRSVGPEAVPGSQRHQDGVLKKHGEAKRWKKNTKTQRNDSSESAFIDAVVQLNKPSFSSKTSSVEHASCCVFRPGCAAPTNEPQRGIPRLSVESLVHAEWNLQFTQAFFQNKHGKQVQKSLTKLVNCFNVFFPKLTNISWIGFHDAPQRASKKESISLDEQVTLCCVCLLQLIQHTSTNNRLSQIQKTAMYTNHSKAHSFYIRIKHIHSHTLKYQTYHISWTPALDLCRIPPGGLGMKKYVNIQRWTSRIRLRRIIRKLEDAQTTRPNGNGQDEKPTIRALFPWICPFQKSKFTQKKNQAHP